MLKTLVIDRATWGAGRHLAVGRASGLLNGAGQRCCLGFLGRDLGMYDDIAYTEPYPSCVLGRQPLPWPTALFSEAPTSDTEGGSRHDWQTVFARLNDADDVADSSREEWLATGFRIVLDIELTFTGAYPDGPRGDDGELLP